MTPEQIKAFNGLLDALDKVPEERRIFMCSAALDMLQMIKNLQDQGKTDEEIKAQLEEVKKNLP